MSEKIQF